MCKRCHANTLANAALGKVLKLTNADVAGAGTSRRLRFNKV